MIIWTIQPLVVHEIIHISLRLPPFMDEAILPSAVRMACRTDAKAYWQTAVRSTVSDMGVVSMGGSSKENRFAVCAMAQRKSRGTVRLRGNRYFG